MTTREPTQAATQRLVLRAQLGDRAALEELLTWTTRWLHPYLSRLSGDPHIADDLTQKSLTRIWKHLGDLREPCAYRAWVYRIASREASRSWKRTKARATVRLTQPFAANAPETLSDDERAALIKDISTLTPNTRAVIALHYGEGMSLSETAAILGIPAGTAKSRLAAALTALRSLHQEQEP